MYAKIVTILRGWNKLLFSLKQDNHKKHKSIYIFSFGTSTLIHV